MKALALLLLTSFLSFAAPTKVTAAWDANPIEDEVVAYVVEYNKPDAVKQSVTVAGLQASVDLSPGLWTFSVYAVDLEGQRGPSSASVSILIEKPAPGQVKGTKVIKIPLQGSNDKIKWKDIGHIYPDKGWQYVRVKA